MALIRVMTKVSNVEYNGKRISDQHEVGELIERGDWIYINPDKLLGVTMNKHRVDDPLSGILPFEWVVYALLDSPYHNQIGLGECVSIEHAQQVIDELLVELTRFPPIQTPEKKETEKHAWDLPNAEKISNFQAQAFRAFSSDYPVTLSFVVNKESHQLYGAGGLIAEYGDQALKLKTGTDAIKEIPYAHLLDFTVWSGIHDPGFYFIRYGSGG